MDEIFEFPVNTPTERFQALRAIVNLLGQRGYANPADALLFSRNLQEVARFVDDLEKFDAQVIGATERLLSLYNIRWATRRGLDQSVVLIAAFAVQQNHFVRVAEDCFNYSDTLSGYIAGGR